MEIHKSVPWLVQLSREEWPQRRVAALNVSENLDPDLPDRRISTICNSLGISVSDVSNLEPLVSIGVPVYNGEKSIGRALDSLLGQTYPNLEIVISDNASTDGTCEICRAYAAKDPRVRYYRNEVKISLQPNYQRTLDLATGEFFMWAAADDVRPLDIIEKCVWALQKNPQAVMVYGPVLLVFDEKHCIEVKNHMDLTGSSASARIRTFVRELSHRTILYGLYRRSALAKTRGWKARAFGTDYHICLQMCMLGPVEYVPQLMITYKVRKMFVIEPVPAYRALSLGNLMRAGSLRGITKRWDLLLRGCRYLLTLRNTSLRQRFTGMLAFLWVFSTQHAEKLARDLIFVLFLPVAKFASIVWMGAQRFPYLARIVRQVKTFLDGRLSNSIS